MTESHILACTDIPAAVDAYLAQYLDQRSLPGNLDEAVRYALLGPGKRTRPTLSVLSCQALSGSASEAMSGACAIEMIHAFSLVHDDLPALDNDELRRGRPTVHVALGEPMAILSGDALMSLAFEMVCASPHAAWLARELSTACTEMIAGQVLDTLGGGAHSAWETLDDLERLRRVHRGKTGALIRCACRVGAISAGAEPHSLEIESLTRYGEAIGLMFQIVDDILDVEQSAEHVGKATGKDREAGKLTYPGILGVAGAKTEVQRLEQEALSAIANLGPAAEPLARLCSELAVRTK